MCQYCESLKYFELEGDIRAQTNYWDYNKLANEPIRIDNWVTVVTGLPIKYCPNCGTKLK